MKEFFKKIFQSKKQKDKQQPSAAADVQEIDKEIDAIYGILVDIIGSDKLVLKAGKLGAMQLLRSPNRGERVLALQRIIWIRSAMPPVP